MLKRFFTLGFMGLFIGFSSAQAQESTWIDITDSYIVNPRFDGNDVTTGWLGTPYSVANPKDNAEHYQKNYDSYQNLQGIPKGKYRVSLNAFYRMGGAQDDYNRYLSGEYNEYQLAELYASSSVDEYSVKIVPISTGAVERSLGGGTATVREGGGDWWGGGGTAYYVPNDMQAAYYWFNAGYYNNSLECEVGKEGELTIGIRKSETLGGDWTCLDNWKLEYWGVPIYVNSLTFTKSTVKMSLGETVQLKYIISPNNTTYKKVKWESSDESILKVDQYGYATAVGTGSSRVTITSTDGRNIQATCTVNVTKNAATAESMIINEVMAANAGMFVDPSWNFGGWIELYNPTSKSVSLADFYVSDDSENLKKCKVKQERSSIPANGFLNLWFDHVETRKDIKEGYVNTQIDMKLNPAGGEIYISDEKGQLITSMEYPPMFMRVSYARKIDGSDDDDWGYTANPTPESTNATSIFASLRLEDPIVDKGGQLFEGVLQVVVNIPEGAILKYTTDGTAPTEDNGEISETGIFSIDNTTCFRFRLFQDGYLPSNIVTRSYIYKDRDYYLPVVSVVTEPDFIYGDELGAYVTGKNGKTANQDGTKRNFNMDWDRPVNFEYIMNEDQEVLNQMVDYSIAGGWSRKYTPRPFKLKSDKQYDINYLPYTFFPDKPYNKNKVVFMRNGGNDEYNQTRLKDASLQEIARQSEFPLNLQSRQPAHVFYNGEYIAMLNMREPSNKQYAYANYGYDTDELDAFEICVDSGYVQKAGTREAFDEWYELTKNAADPDTYEEIRKRVDIDDFINYMAFKLFLNDWDWPHNNCKGFRNRNDGKFHFVVFDLDNCVDRSGNNIFTDFEKKQTWTFYSRPEYNNTSLTKEVELVTIFLNMLENEEFKRQFIDTYCIVGGSVFRDEQEIADIVNGIASVNETALSWENHSPWGSGRSFAQGIINAVTGNFKTNMTNMMRRYYRFNLSNITPQMVKLQSDVAGANILLNGLEVPKGKFDGYLFSPVVLKAVPPVGYRFKGWAINGSTVNETTTIFDTKDEWRYYDQGSLDDTGWEQEDFADGQWPTGNGGFGYGKEGKPMSEATTILDKGPESNNVRPTYYFRKEFTLDKAPTENETFRINYEVDDGIIVYINGQETGLYHMQSGASYSNYSEDYNGSWYELDDPYRGSMDIDNSLLKKGKNVIAVELHNCVKTSSDVWWDCSLTKTSISENVVDDFYSTEEEIEMPDGEDMNITACYEEFTAEELAASNIHSLCINEVSAANSIYINDHEKKNDWVEIYNTTDEDIDLEGWYISDNESKPYKYQISKGESQASTIVPAHGFILIWCDKLAPINQLHATFKLAAEGGSVLLTPEDKSWSDILRYPPHNGDMTVGRFPNGAEDVYVMNIPTIKKKNVLTTMVEVASQDEQSTGINNVMISSNNGLKIYYSDDMVVVRSEDSPYADLYLYTMSGQEVAKTRLYFTDERATFQLGALPTGIYVAKAKDVEGNVCSTKFIYK